MTPFLLMLRRWHALPKSSAITCLLAQGCRATLIHRDAPDTGYSFALPNLNYLYSLTHTQPLCFMYMPAAARLVLPLNGLNLSAACPAGRCGTPYAVLLHAGRPGPQLLIPGIRIVAVRRGWRLPCVLAAKQRGAVRPARLLRTLTSIRPRRCIRTLQSCLQHQIYKCLCSWAGASSYRCCKCSPTGQLFLQFLISLRHSSHYFSFRKRD